MNFKKNIFITGAGGFIGRNLVENFEGKYNIFAPLRSELDLLDENAAYCFLKENKIDVVIHCANHDDSRNANVDTGLALHNNLCMFFNLVKYRELYGKMFYFGSGRGYDKCYYVPKMDEDYFGEHIPVDNYGFSKYVMAKYAERIPGIHEFRLFGCFGKYEDWEIRFISYACCKAVFNQNVVIHQNINMDYLYINDLVRLMDMFIQKYELKYCAYNLCSGRTIDLLSIVDKLSKIAGKKMNVILEEKNLQKEYSGNNKRLIDEIGLFKFTDIDVAIGELFNWYSENRRLIDEKLLFLNK